MPGSRPSQIRQGRARGRLVAHSRRCRRWSRTSPARSPSRASTRTSAWPSGAAIQGGVLGGEVKDILLPGCDAALAGHRDGGRRVHPPDRPQHDHPDQPTRARSSPPPPTGRPSVEVHVLQGEREMAQYNKTLGRFPALGASRPRRAGVPQIEVTFDIDANGIVHVSAKDLGTGQPAAGDHHRFEHPQRGRDQARRGGRGEVRQRG